MVADLFEADHQQYGVAYIVLSSVAGISIGPVVGAFIQRHLSWRWNFWVLRSSPLVRIYQSMSRHFQADSLQILAM